MLICGDGAYPKVQPAIAEQTMQLTANNIITECPLYLPPNGFHGLIDVDADATTCERLPTSSQISDYFF